jgi:hypothetical protein
MWNKVSLLLLFVFISIVSFAQPKPILLTGKVMNERNEVLPGAYITVEGLKQVVADVEGRFSIPVTADKKYDVTISSVGYAPKKLSDISVRAGQEDELMIVLAESKKNQLGEVSVRATSRKQESTTALIAFQKNNSALSSGLAADFIRRTPDKNTGEVLRRVSGASIQDNKFVVVRGLADRYNSAFINGAMLPSSEPDKKAFSFDVIPSQLIDNIVINKTATPDLTGEFAGGLIQIQTKDIPTSNQLIVGTSLGFNTQSVFEDFISNPRGASDFLGFQRNRSMPGSYPRKYLDYSRLDGDQRLAISQAFRDDVYGERVTTAAPIQSHNITWANAKRFKNGSALGSVVGVTYRQSSLLYNATKTLFERGDNSQAFFDYVDRQNRFNVNWGGVANIAWSNKRHKIAFKNLFNQLFDDNYYVRTGINTENLQDIQLRSSVLNQRSLYSSQLEGSHTLTRRNIRVQWNLNYAFNDKSQPDLRVQTYGKSIGVNEPYRINLRGNNTNRFFSELKDHVFGYTASASLPFSLGGLKQTLKVGGSATVRIRDFKAFIFGYTEPQNQALLALPYDQIFSRNNFGGNGFLFQTDLQNVQDRYFGVSALSAGYLMLDNKLSEKIRLVWGTRIEYFEQVLKSNIPGSDKAQVIETNKADFLPSVNFTYSPTIKTNIRLAASRTVARPEFREIAPFTFFDFEQIASTQGTPNLQRSSILNFDARYELYPAAGEIVSFGAFYKQFADPIELRLNSASVATRRQYQFQNAENAKLFGVEAEFRKKLGFLAPNVAWLENLYFNGNASLIFSEVSLGNVDADGNKLPSTNRPLQGQSPYLINAGFQYDGKDGLSASVLYNRIGERLSLVGNDDFGNIFEKPRNLVDIQISKKIMKKKGEVRLTVGDIFNQPIATYENRDSKNRFNAATDKTFSSFRPGTTFTLGFNYTFDLK